MTMAADDAVGADGDAGSDFAWTGRAKMSGAGASAAGDGDVLAPMPGRIVQVQVESGQKVRRGEPLVTLEAMKMEHVLTAPFDGVVSQLFVSVGGQTSEGAPVAKISPVSD